MESQSPESGSLHVVVVIPVGVLEGAKSRLGETLDAEERRDLVTFLLRRTIEVARRSPGLDVLVVSPDREVLKLAAEGGVDTVRQVGQGLNRGLHEARDAALARGADAIVVLPIDLPLLSIEALSEVLAPLRDPERPVVVLVPDRAGRGTNALAVAPPGAIEFSFGGDSRAAHLACAREVDARVVELPGGPLTVDLDTPDDLLLVEELAPEAVGVG
jgi:2-phospho-L-lactate/phosphoenolpyruvate guanylyltransferase